MPKLFILDDDDSLLFALRYCFEEKGYEVHTFISAEKLLNALRAGKPDFLLIDVYLTRSEHGGELCYYLKKELRLSCPVYLFSSTLLSYHQFRSYEADGFILKRTNLDCLIKIVSSCILTQAKNSGMAHSLSSVQYFPQQNNPSVAGLTTLPV